MKRIIFTIMSILLISISSVFAHTEQLYGHHHTGMMIHNYWGIGFIFPLVLWGGLIGLIIYILSQLMLQKNELSKD